MMNDVISTGCIHLSSVVLLLELTLLGVWYVQPLSDIVHVLQNAIEDSSEIIDYQCGFYMTGECVCVEVDICTDVVSVSISVINKCTATYTMYITVYTKIYRLMAKRK